MNLWKMTMSKLVGIGIKNDAFVHQCYSGAKYMNLVHGPAESTLTFVVLFFLPRFVSKHE